MLGDKGANLHALASPREAPPEDSFGYVFSGAEYNTAVWVAKGLVDAGVLSESNWRDSDTVRQAALFNAGLEARPGAPEPAALLCGEVHCKAWGLFVAMTLPIGFGQSARCGRARQTRSARPAIRIELT